MRELDKQMENISIRRDRITNENEKIGFEALNRHREKKKQREKDIERKRYREKKNLEKKSGEKK